MYNIEYNRTYGCACCWYDERVTKIKCSNIAFEKHSCDDVYDCVEELSRERERNAIRRVTTTNKSAHNNVMHLSMSLIELTKFN